GTKTATGAIDRIELARQKRHRFVRQRHILHDDGGGGTDGPERTRRQRRRLGDTGHEVPPDVTAGRDELLEGAVALPDEAPPVSEEAELSPALVLVLEVADPLPPVAVPVLPPVAEVV